jgi:hypothetical protein
MTVNDIDNFRKLNAMTAPSDNTRVVSPYRIRAKGQSRPNIATVNRQE